jgi:hypothetical protein
MQSVLQFRAGGVNSKSRARRRETSNRVLLSGVRRGSQRSADLRRLFGRHLPPLRHASGIFR